MPPTPPERAPREAPAGSPLIEFLLKRTGILFVLSAPSGGGKSTILRALREHDPSLGYSISVTTRPPRGDEEDGREYFFRSEDEFARMDADNAFLETARVHGNMYGTLRDQIEGQCRDGKDVLLDIDVQGSLALKKERPDTVLLFVLPPSIATLERRLRSRGLDDEAAMQVRLANARHEVRYARHYDYIMVNQDLEQTIRTIRRVIDAERHRAHRIDVRDAHGEIEFLRRDDEAPAQG